MSLRIHIASSVKLERLGREIDVLNDCEQLE
jgi:hypothetical protein